MEVAEAWLTRVSERTAAVFESLRKRESKLPDQLLKKFKQAFVSAGDGGKEHEDLGAVSFAGVGVIVAATKWDLFERSTEPELRRVMARALRCANQFWRCSADVVHAPSNSSPMTTRRILTQGTFATDTEPVLCIQLTPTWKRTVCRERAHQPRACGRWCFNLHSKGRRSWLIIHSWN